ncbi:MAG TPA: hypothetical protein VKA57_06730 [Solirubrobacteraceae bacterium]|nr:hypothetical protein [Solirubrobacteraceae bacterium]
MPELVAIWVAGLVVLLLFWALSAAILRFTRVGRAQELSARDLFKVLAVCVALSCALYSLVSLAL